MNVHQVSRNLWLFQKYDVIPDLTIFGKTIGNGYALTAVVGKKSIMELRRQLY